MKTLTIKTEQNIPVFGNYTVFIDGYKTEVAKPGETIYLEIPIHAKTILIKMSRFKSNILDISETKHHQIIINNKKQLLLNYIFLSFYILLNFSIEYFFNIGYFYSSIIGLSIVIPAYFIYIKTIKSIIQIELKENI